MGDATTDRPSAAFDRSEGVIYDLDGTLIRLAVDWDAVAEAVAELLRAEGVEPVPSSLWDMLDVAAPAGLGEAVESTVAGFERTGARRSERLPAADCLADETRPVGICSSNAESACRLALETHGLMGPIGTVVGRDSHPTRKPDPGPLLAAIEELDLRPSAAVFVGDTPSDAEAARRADVAFVHVDALLDRCAERR